MSKHMQIEILGKDGKEKTSGFMIYADVDADSCKKWSGNTVAQFTVRRFDGKEVRFNVSIRLDDQESSAKIDVTSFRKNGENSKTLTGKFLDFEARKLAIFKECGIKE